MPNANAFPKNPSSIQVLPRELAEKIAAGEIIERPGSAIKELIENAIDANSRAIRIEIEDGGRKRIAVSDNGHGIRYAEVPIALERHATSKIQKLEDLWNLSTMGFRGEALPSIAAISRFTIETKTADQEHGRLLYFEGGRLLKDEKTLADGGIIAHGTCVTVEDLFFNVPARLKFLRSKNSESAFIRELIERIALCNPGIAFHFFSEGKRSLNLQPASIERRVAAIFETDPEEIETVESLFEQTQIRGWIDRNARVSNSKQVYLSVNGRMVRDKLLQQAVLMGLRPRMMEGEYPKIYLDVQVAPEEVDVNVHPAKAEVRFRRSRDVFQLIYGALEKLSQTPTRPFYSASLPASAQTPSSSDAPFQSRLSLPEQSVFKTKSDFEPRPASTASGAISETPRTTTKVAEDRDLASEFSKLHYIGQLKNTYLLFQDAEGLVLVDQHAAHERINYERIKSDFLESGLKPQPLLISAVVKCKAEDVALALENVESFEKLGFEIEAFGDNCILVRSAPVDLPAERANELFSSLLSELKDSESKEIMATDPSRLSAKLERMLSTAACHGSVRAGQSLSPNEARELLKSMDQTPSSLNCPHGRPASIRMTYSQIEALFKR
ncbi:MAG: DNA mismatch repair endonuclease MutL [Bdellovibrionota bacterium]